MFCPQCGSKQSDELRFCNLCGANLLAVRQVVAAREGEEKFDWSKTWVAEMLMSEAERKKRLAERERERGMTPEVKRFNEIKAGVITSCVGIGVMLFLYVIGMAIFRGGQNPPEDAEIVRSIWVAGVIPFMVGIALIINGLFVSKRMVELARRQEKSAPGTLDAAPERPTLRPADTSEFIPPGHSVTEGTTRHLQAEQNRER